MKRLSLVSAIILSAFLFTLTCGTGRNGGSADNYYIQSGMNKIAEKKYDDAVRYFYIAAEADNGDRRASYGVALATLEKYRNLLAGAGPAAGGAKTGVEKAYTDFVKLLDKKNWKGIIGAVSTLSVLHGSGAIVADDASLRANIDAYLGLITSAAMNAYLKTLTVEGVRVKGDVAGVYLKAADGSAYDEVYLVFRKGSWKMALFPGSIITGGSK